MPDTIAQEKEELDRLGRKLLQIPAQEDTLKSLEQKDFANQVTLAAILARLNITLSALRDALRGASTKDFSTLETDIESLLTETQKLTTPVSIHDSSTGAALSVTLEIGHRSFVEVWMKTSAAATFKVYGSKDNTNWRECDEIPFTGAGELHNGYWNGYKYVKVSTTAANNNEIEITAS